MRDSLTSERRSFRFSPSLSPLVVTSLSPLVVVSLRLCVVAVVVFVCRLSGDDCPPSFVSELTFLSGSSTFTCCELSVGPPPPPTRGLTEPPVLLGLFLTSAWGIDLSRGLRTTAAVVPAVILAFVPLVVLVFLPVMSLGDEVWSGPLPGFFLTPIPASARCLKPGRAGVGRVASDAVTVGWELEDLR